MTEIDAETGRRAVRIGDDCRTFGEDRLFEIVRRKCHAALGEARFKRRRHAVVLFSLDAEKLSDQFCGQIICRRPQAAGADDDIAELLRLAQGPEHLVAVVANFHYRGDADAQCEQAIGDEGRVGVDHFAGGQFIAGTQDNCFFDHNHRQ